MSALQEKSEEKDENRQIVEQVQIAET